MKTIRSITRAIIAMTIGYAGIPDDVASADTITWTNATSGNWSMANNWNPNQVPGSGDTVLITNVGSYAVTLDVNATVGSLTLGGSSGTQSLVQNANTLTLTNSSSIGANGSYNFSGGTINGAGSVAVNGVLNWSGGTFNGSSMTITPGALLNLTGGSGKYLQNVLTNYGVVEWLGGSFIVENYNGGYKGAVENGAGGLWDVQCDQNLYDEFGGGTPYFHNAGTFQKTAGTGTTTVSIPFNNGGNVAAQTGTISFNGGGVLESNFSAGAGAKLQFSGGTFSYGVVPVLTGPGAIQFTGGALTLVNDVIPGLQLTGGTITLGPAFQGGTITNLNFGGSLSGNYAVSGTLTLGNGDASGALTVLGGATLNWSGGNVGGLTLATGGILNWSGGGLTGGLDITNGAVANWSGGTAGSWINVQTNGQLNLTGGSGKYLQNVLTNYGVVEWLGGSFIVENYNGGYKGAVENGAGGLWDVQCDQNLYDEFGGGTPYFHNAGTFQKTAGTGTTTVSIPFNNGGNVAAQTGTISFNGGGVLESNFSAGAGAKLQFSGGTFSYGVVPVLTGPGAIQFTGGALTLVNDVIPGLQLTGGTITLGPAFQGGTITNLNFGGSLSGNYAVSGTLTLGNGDASGALTVLGGATLNWSGGNVGGLTLATGGILNWSGGGLTGGLDITNGAVANWSGGTAGSWINVQTNGQLNLTGGSGKYLQNVLTNYGVVEWLGGSFIVENYNGGYKGAVENGAGGLWDVQCDQNLYDEFGGGTPYFHNAGTFQKTAGTGTTTVSIPFNNGGNVAAQTGTISFNGGGVLESNFSAGAGAKLQFSGGTFSYGVVPVLTGPGAIQFTGGALTLVNDVIPGLQLTGGTITLGPAFQGGTITNLNFGGSLSGNYAVSGTLTLGNGDASGALTVLGGATLNWSGGNVGGLTLATGGILNWSGGGLTGGLDITNGAVANWSGGTAGSWINVQTNGQLNLTGGSGKYLQNVLTNYGVVEWLGGSFIVENYNGGYKGAVENGAGGLWDVQCDQNLYDEFGGGTPYFHNAGTFQKTAGTGTTTVSIPFNNGGNVAAQTGTISFNGGGVLESNFSAGAGAKLQFSGGTFSYGVVPVLTGPGAIQFTGGALTLVNDVIPGLQLTGGTITLGPAFQGGTITNLNFGGSLSGNYAVSGTLTLGNGDASGALTVLGGATLNWSGGNVGGLTLATGGILNWSGGGLTGGLDITNGAVANWSGGTAGSWINVQTNGQLNLTGGSGKYLQNVLTNYGVVEWLGGSFIVENYNGGYKGAVENGAGGLWDVQCDQNLYDEFGGGTPYFHNAGTFQKTAGTGTTTVSIPFNNGGNVAAQTGTISFNGGGVLESNFSAGAGAKLQFSGGTFSYGVVPVLTGPGAIQFTGGALTLVNDVIPGLQLTGGTITLGPAFQGGTITNLNFGGSLSGNYAVSGTLTLGNGDASGALTVLGGATLNWSGGNVGGLTLATGGILNWSGGGLTGGLDITNGAVANWSGGTAGSWINVQTNGQLNLTGGSGKYLQNVLTNYGVVEWLGGSFIVENYNGGYKGAVENGAGGLWDVQCDQNLYDEFGGGTPYFHNAGTFQKTAGTGTTTVSIPFNNGGNVAAQTGTISFNSNNSYGQTAATLQFGLNGPAHSGKVNIAGNINFDGTLSASLVNGYVPQTGDTISLVTYGSRAGTFNNLSLPALSSSLGWQVAYSSGAMQIQVVSNANTTAQITGLVSDGQGHGIADVTVFAYTTNSSGGVYLSAVTDGGGNYSMSVSNGIWVVGLQGLPAQGYNPVANQSVTVNNANQTASFVLQPYSGQLYAVTTTVNPPGAGTANGGGIFTPGSPVVVTAAANTATLPYYFTNWTENSVFQSANSTYSFLAQRSRQLTANFTLPTFTITVSNNPPSAGSVMGARTNIYGDLNVLTAQPNFGYAFSNWTENGTVLGTGLTLNTVVYTNHVIVANYAEVNLSHVVTTATQPDGIAAVSGAGIYTNGQAATFSAPSSITISPYLYKFQNFTVSNVVVSTSASFNKTFTTTDQTNLHYIANYSSLNIVPQVTNTMANYSDPVPATTNLVFTFQFDRTMNTNVTPSVFLTNATAMLQVTASGVGHWSSRAELNDTYLAPPMTVFVGMDGLNQVFISDASDANADILGLTNTLNLTVDATPPLLATVVANPGVTSCSVSWSSDEAASSQVEFGLNTSYGSLTSLYGQLVKAHGLTLAGLNPNTLYHFRVHSRDLAGNETISEDNTFTTLAAPDLQVQNLTVTGTFISGGNLVISWDDANTGAGDTYTSWYDGVIVTNATTGQTLQNTTVYFDASTGNIPSGGSRARQLNFHLPDGASGAGELHILVTANIYNNQFETTVDNNRAGIQENSTLPNYPDLQVANLVITNLSLQSGGTIGLSWQDTNSGTAAVNDSFQDRVTVVNLDTTQTLVNAGVAYDANATGAIGAGLSAGRQFSFTLPNGSSGAGNLQITVTADGNNNVYEFNVGGTAEANNSSSVAEVSTLAAYPDLAVTNIAVPANASAGQTIQVVWTDLNLGNASATNAWSDQIFLSDTAAIGGGQLLGTFQITSNLSAGSSLTFTQSVMLPQFAAGNQWIIVKANAGNSFYETNLVNNSLVSTQAVAVGATLTLALSRATVSESAGVGALTGTVTRNGDTTSALTVNLGSETGTDVSLPTSVIIPAGQHAASFSIGVTDQQIAGGSITKNIVAAAAGFSSASAPLTILYDDVAMLTLTLNTNAVPEDAAPGVAMGTVTRNANFNQPLTVSLISDLATALTAPATIKIPVGQASANFDLTPVNDNIVGDTRRVHLLASATGMNTVSATIDVLNVNTVTLSLDLADGAVAKGAASPATIGTVSRQPVAATAQNVLLTVSGSSLVTMPGTVTIPAGAESVNFNVNVGDDQLVTGSQKTTVTAQALTPAGLVDTTGQASTLLVILDTHGPSLKVVFGDTSIAKGSNTTVTVTRNTPPTNSLTVNLSANPSDAITYPPSVVIPQNQTSVTVGVTGVLDNIQTGPRSISLVASATDYNAGVGNLTVSDIYYADLTPTSLTFPTNAVTGQKITLNWVVANRGLADANGSWLDYIYLASDSLGQQPTLVNFKANAAPLPIGASYTNQASFTLPQAPGNYWIVLTTDGGKVVSEITKQNNSAITPIPVVVDASYRAVLTGVSPAVAAAGTPITFTGNTFNPVDHSLMPLSAATVRVLVNGTRRVFGVTSDANGNFFYTFQPLANEAGAYTAGADYPLVLADSNQVSFALLGMQALPGGLAAQLLPNTSLTGQLMLSNLTDHTLTDLAISVPDLHGNLDAQFIFTNTTLPGNGTMTVGYQLQSSLTRAAQIKFSMTATSAEGAKLAIPAVVSVVPLIAQLEANPAYLTRGMLVGAQTSVSFDIVNTGGAASGDLTLQLPGTLPWMTLSSPTVIPSIPPGGKATVILTLNPPANLPLTLYQGSLAAANNNTGISVPFQFRAMSSGKGDLRVTATDEYTYYVSGAPKVTNATVTVRDAITMAVIAQTNSDASGIAYFAGLAEGNYTVDASATSHNPSRGSASVVTGTTNDLEAFMSRQLVSYQWTVVPTEIADEYQIQLQSVFETEVPVPNVVIEEPKVMLFVFPGEASQFDFTLRNEGLIAAQGVTITPPNDPNYLITPLVTDVGTIPAMSAVTIPVTVQLRAAPAVPLAAGNGVFPKDDPGDCPVSISPCLPSVNLNAQYYVTCGGHNVVQGRSAQLALLCEAKDTADKIKACLNDMKELVGSKNLASVGCNAISAFLNCVGADLGPCQTLAISTACGALTGGVAGAAAAGLPGLPACICAHLSDIPLPSFPHSDTGGNGGSSDLLLPILPTGSYYVSGNPVLTSIYIGSCSDTATPSLRNGNMVSRAISPISPLNFKAPVRANASGGICAHVRLEIDQDVVLTRTAFTGTLQIDNGGSTAISDIQVNLTFQDATNGNVSGKFVTEGPVLNTLSAVDGSGNLAGGATGSAVYTFIPTLDAAPYAPETFQIGGTLSYLDNGEPVVVPLLSSPITVYPEARLDLAYFQQRDVYGDDPFTSQIEPSEPFALGLLVKNVGAGNAHNFRITSGQPKIIDNEKGLLINFNIIGTEVGDQPVSPSLTASLGDITPGGVKEVTWDMLSTLQGKFISYNATFQHVNDLGVTNTSLINSVEIHELIHRVLANQDGDDDLPDFLVNDLPDPGNLPDTLYLSDGTEAAVNVFTNDVIDGAAAAGHMQVQLTAAVSSGWNYIQVPDPGAGFRLDHVVRSDGKILALTNNAWTTDRSFPASSTAAVTENLLHLFDWAGSGAYTLYYRSTNTTPPVIVQLGPVTPFVQPGAVSSVNIVFSEPVNLATFDSSALTLTRNGGANLINSGSGVTIAKVTDTTYAINGLQTLTATAGNYQLTVNGAGIYDLWGNSAGNVSTSVQWTSGNAPVVVQSLDAILPNPRNAPVTSVNVTFSKPINPATLNDQALSLTLNGGPDLITSGVTVTPVSGNTYAINGLGALTGAAGNYLLTVDATAIQDAGDITGFGIQSTAWTMVTTGPRIVTLEQLATNPRNIVVQSLNVTFAQPIDPTTFDYHAVNLSLNGGPNLITSDVTMTPVTATTYKIANFNWVVGSPGAYAFTVDASGLSDLAGNSGSGSTNENWQMILDTPASPTNLVITPDTGIFTNDGLTDTNSVVLSGTLGTTNLAVRVSDQTSGSDIGSAIVNGTNFNITLIFTTQGQHQLKLTAVDVAGNVSAASYFNLFLDTTPPTAIIQAVTPNPVSWPVTNLLVTFSKAINTNTVSAANFTLTRDGASVGTPEIFILSSNAVLVTGLIAPTTPTGNYQLTLDLTGVQDLAGNSSTRTVSTTWQNVPVNAPPTIVQEANTTARPGQTLQRQIQATDPEGNHFIFSLTQGVPAGAVITTNGLFRWTPACDQGGTTNIITVTATDDGVPPASSSMAFIVSVGDCLQIGVGSTVVQIGTTGSVPVTVYSSAGVTNLSFTLAYPTNQFANWTIAASNNVVGTAAALTLNSSQAVFNVSANAGGSLQGSALLGSISFKALPAPSAFVPLNIASAAGTKLGQSAIGSIVSKAGRVVVIGAQSLLEAKIGTGFERQVILYGNPGASYQLAFNTNLASTSWLPMWRVPMTNLYQTFDVGDVAPQVFYRAWEFSADPPILELGLPEPTNAALLLYGQNGTNYVIESATNLGLGTIWFPWTNLVLSNSFQFIPVNNLTNQAMFFRAKH